MCNESFVGVHSYDVQDACSTMLKDCVHALSDHHILFGWGIFNCKTHLMNLPIKTEGRLVCYEINRFSAALMNIYLHMIIYANMFIWI